MEGLGKDRAHGLLLVFQPRTEPAVSPPPGGTTVAFDISHMSTAEV